MNLQKFKQKALQDKRFKKVYDRFELTDVGLYSKRNVRVSKWAMRAEECEARYMLIFKKNKYILLNIS